MSAPSFFTQATNFISATKGRVDPRTGMFCFELRLGKLLGNNGLGPAFPIVIRYNPLASLNGPLAGDFGAGVSLGITTYDTSTSPGRVMLSTGEQYVIRESGDLVSILQQKLKTIIFEKIEANGGYHYEIAHKNGTLEILDGSANPDDCKHPTQIVNHLGYPLNLKWSYESSATDHWNPPRLMQICDTHDALLEIDYLDDTHTVFKFLPANQSEGYQVHLTIKDGLLAQIDNYAVTDKGKPLSWQLTYDTVGDSRWGQWLTQVALPGGLTQTAEYSSDAAHGAAFPGGAHLPRLPRVSRYTRDPGGNSVAMVSSYDYRDGNFLGNGANSGISWDSNTDYLLGQFDDDYTYSTVETRSFTDSLTQKAKNVSITRTYNSYHLLLKRSRTQDDCNLDTVIDYYVTDGNFEDQPPQYQLPQTVTRTWKKGSASRIEVTQTEFDEYGNMTSRTDPSPGSNRSGTVTQWKFYSYDGSDSGCPKDQYPFQRFVKSIRITPEGSDYHDAPVKYAEYQYSEFPGGPVT